jgi:hypothetical protein
MKAPGGHARAEARRAVAEWIEDYNRDWRHPHGHALADRLRTGTSQLPTRTGDRTRASAATVWRGRSPRSRPDPCGRTCGPALTPTASAAPTQLAEARSRSTIRQDRKLHISGLYGFRGLPCDDFAEALAVALGAPRQYAGISMPTLSLTRVPAGRHSACRVSTRRPSLTTDTTGIAAALGITAALLDDEGHTG